MSLLIQHIELNSKADTSQKLRFQLTIYLADTGNNLRKEIIFLPCKEATYLWAWLDAKGVQKRSNAKALGYNKAGKLAQLISRRNIHSLNFKSDFEAYAFFKKHFDNSFLALLLGKDHDEIATKLEENNNYKVLGGYLGGETESKDKTRFKTFLLKNLKDVTLVNQLLPEPLTNRSGKRIQNQFQFTISNYKIL